ncbi:hypothetical protein [Pontixanthobacter sp.]|uniref:hypothetical protein n=1 Tax=Pontixanthobacter sp. TaxID=2792078 RepID=UPI003C79D8CD
MSEERIETAVNRIEAALARIAEVANNPSPTPQSVSALVVKHEALRDAASTALNDIDSLIAEIGE